MDRIIGTLLLIDAAIQRRFDAFIFFLMRRFGWQKSIIRYALWGVILLCALIDIYCQWIKAGCKLQWKLVWDGLWILPMIFLQWRDHKYDRAAEEKGMRSLADAHPLGMIRVIKALIFFCTVQWVQITGLCWLLPRKGSPYMVFISKVNDISITVFLLSYLSLLYLACTPPTAPPEKEKAGVLVPAPQHSS